MNNELISIIMSIYKEPREWLEASVESILSQTYRNFEFILVLDCPDNKMLQSVLEEYAQRDARIQILVNKQNEGLIYSLNHALKFAQGAYIARMDADDIAHPDRLERQLGYLHDNNLDLVGSNINLFREEGNFFATTDKLIAHESIKKLLCQGTTIMAHPTFFAKREVYDTLGGYGTAEHVEDKEFLARAICEGYRVGNTSDVLLDYRHNDQSVTKIHTWFVEKNGEKVTQEFCRCIKHGQDTMRAIVPSDPPSKKEAEQFRNKQKYIGLMREHFAKKKYIRAGYMLARSLLLNSRGAAKKIMLNISYRGLRYWEKKTYESKAVKKDLKDAHAVMLSLLMRFDRACQKHHLIYWLDHGTLLGAVRHGGFIPWDDDLDVTMPREDYERFIEIASKELGDDLFLQTHTNDKYYLNFFAKIRDRKSTYIDTGEAHKNIQYHQGIFIDVFPVNFIQKNSRNFYLYQYVVFISKLVHNRLVKSRRLAKPLVNYLNSMHDKNKDFVVSGGENMHYVIHIDKERVFPLSSLKFEGHLFPVPRDTDTYLKRIFGEDYMTPPSEENRVMHSVRIEPHVPCRWERERG